MKKIFGILKFVFPYVQLFLYWLMILILVVVGGIVALSSLNLPNGIKLFAVKSGSMRPAIPVGSIVAVQPQERYRIKDVVTYKREEDRKISNPEFTTTHRIVEIKKKDNKNYYITKGDANNAPDGKLIDKDLIIGKVIFYIPFLGYPVSFAKKPFGFAMLVIIPASIIIYSEIINIKNEIIKIFQKRKKAKNERKSS